ncbi:LysM peptidoglycan-binding domain-containing protein [Burkholderiaceae bacterium DAT-1]|nr:LysM peptidoglycan-binding domain-containing protein [Burkholderiaceae bacterium DAT-1]
MHMSLLKRPSFGRTLLSAAIISLGLAAGVVKADEIRLADNAPERYVVVKGDTLWGISGKFLKDPWKWPQIWNLNKEEIANPHWIFPGDVIVMDMEGGQPHLRLLKNDGNDIKRDALKHDRVSPGIRITQFADQAAPTIPAHAIEPFLARPMVIDRQAFEAAPRVALGPDDHLSFSVGDKVYASGLSADVGSMWQSFRGGRELKDPVNGEVLGYEVEYTGDLQVVLKGAVSGLKVTRSVQEINIGNRLVRREDGLLPSYVPHVPSRPIDAKVLSALGGGRDVGTYSTIVINRGANAGLELGHVLNVFKAARELNRENKKDPVLYAPGEKVANLFVYRVFPRVSYALVLDASQAVSPSDDVRNP